MSGIIRLPGVNSFPILPNPPEGKYYFGINDQGEAVVQDHLGNISSLVGPIGAQGATGPSGGEQGVTGLQGLQGEQGATGLDGLDGITGLTGETGVQGLQGEQGATGLQGLDGDEGLQGETGVQGLQGLKGSTGLQGLNGSQGETGLSGGDGAQGIQGSTGLQGLEGDQGATGLQGKTGIGLTGATGLQGLEGDQGATGLKGSTGLQGLEGDQGATGLKGETGLQGLDGAQGETGLQGFEGDQGATGAQGSQGETGVQGLDGNDGLQGETGLQGSQGDQGATGIQGLEGEQGATGLQGIQGEVGETGLQGLEGIQGVTGLQGLDGDEGPQGVTGLASEADSFWDRTSNNLYPKNIGDNVGIGMTGPEHSLDVAGDIRGTTGLFSAGLRAESDIQSNGFIYGATGLGTSIPSFTFHGNTGLGMYPITGTVKGFGFKVNSGSATWDSQLEMYETGNLVISGSRNSNIEGPVIKYTAYGAAGDKTADCVAGKIAGQFLFEPKTSAGFPRIASFGAIYEGGSTGTEGSMFFSTRDPSGDYLERMRIKQTGNVGIGVTDPAYKLDVAGDIYASENIVSAANIVSQNSDGVSTFFTPSGRVELGVNQNTDTATYIDFHAHADAFDYDARIIRSAGVGGPLRLMQKGTGGFIFSGGDVRVDDKVITQDTLRSMIGGNQEEVERFRFGRSDDMTQQNLRYHSITSCNDSAGPEGNFIAIKVHDTSDARGEPSEVMRFRGDGRVGIGTTDPSVNLEVIGSSDGAFLITNTYNNNTNKLGRWVGLPYKNSDIKFQILDCRGLNGRNELWWGGGSNILASVREHRFFTSNNTEDTFGDATFTVTAVSGSPRVGVNTTTPTAELDVEGDARVNGDLVVEGSININTNNLGSSDTVLDLGAYDYFNKSVSTNQSFTFTNAPSSKNFVVAVYNSSATTISVDFPSSVKWNKGAAQDMVLPSSWTLWTFIKMGSDYFATDIKEMS